MSDIRLKARRTLSDPDGLLWSARDLFPLQYYRDPFNILTATGSCPFRCHFCSVAAVWEGRRRMRSPGRIVAELEGLALDYSAEYVFFTDDLFTLDRACVP